MSPTTPSCRDSEPTLAVPATRPTPGHAAHTCPRQSLGAWGARSAPGGGTRAPRVPAHPVSTRAQPVISPALCWAARLPPSRAPSPGQVRTAPGSSGSSARSLRESPLPPETGGEQGLGRPISQTPLNKAQAGGGGFCSRVLGARTHVHADRDRHTGQLGSPGAEARGPQEAGVTRSPGSGKDRSAGARVTPKRTTRGQRGCRRLPAQHPPRDCSWSRLP